MFNPGDIVEHTIMDWRGTVVEQSDISGLYTIDINGSRMLINGLRLKLVKAKTRLTEWVDPTTGERHDCPEVFIKGLRTILGKGATNAKTATQILQELGTGVSESNKRHIRSAALFLKQTDLPVIAIRAGSGGYFIAETYAELKDYADQQRKFANVMLNEAAALMQKFSSTLEVTAAC